MFDTHQFTRLQLLDFPALRHVWLTSAKPLWLDRSPIRFRTCTQCIMYVSRYEVVRVIKISRRGHAPVVERNVRIGAHRPQASAAVGPCCREAASEHQVHPLKPRSHAPSFQRRCWLTLHRRSSSSTAVFQRSPAQPVDRAEPSKFVSCLSNSLGCQGC